MYNLFAKKEVPKLKDLCINKVTNNIRLFYDLSLIIETANEENYELAKRIMRNIEPKDLNKVESKTVDFFEFFFFIYNFNKKKIKYKKKKIIFKNKKKLKSKTSDINKKIK